jgi:hypothetical protein
MRKRLTQDGIHAKSVMGERVGFEKALSGRYFAFNEMPPTVVLTGQLGSITSGTIVTEKIFPGF